MSKCWQNGDKLIFTHPATLKPTNGTMRGYATVDMAVTGRGLIVELDDSFDFNGGRFKFLIVMEVWVLWAQGEKY